MIKQIIENNHPGGLDESSDRKFPGFHNLDAITSINSLSAHQSYANMAKTIVSTFKPKTILELGSGGGSLSRAIRGLDSNIIYVSVDINKAAASGPHYSGENSYHFIGYTDKPLHFVNDAGETIIFDLILSFEHFEHILLDTFSVFLDNIKRHMNRDTIILASAAKNGDPKDRIHVHVKPKEEWVRYLTDNGFRMLNMYLLNTENRPFNFTPDVDTTQLIFMIN